jgi:membrane protein DedA with SNARE-associated domain
MDIGTITSIVLAYRYWVLFPIACIEGPIFSFFIGTLVALGYFDAVLAYPILVSGDLIPDTMLYYIGKYGHRSRLVEKYASKIGVSGSLAPVERMWSEHPRKMMVFAKLAIGLSTPLLVSAGLAGIKPRIFFGIAIPVALAQHVVLMLLGFYFGNSYVLVKQFVGHAEFLLIILAVFGVAFYLVGIFVKRRFFKAEKEML